MFPDVIATTTTTAVLMFINNGDSPPSFTMLSAASPGSGVVSLALSDVDADGRLDVLGQYFWREAGVSLLVWVVNSSFELTGAVRSRWLWRVVVAARYVVVCGVM